MAEDLSKIRTEDLWDQITVQNERVKVERDKGVGVGQLIRWENLIHEMVSRVEYVESEKPELWAFSFNDGCWNYENSNFASKQEVLEQAAGAAIEYELDLDDAVYICRQMPVGEALIRDIGGILEAETLIYERAFEHLEVGEDCEVSKDDIADLDRRLLATLRAWVRDKSPFDNWWVPHPDQPRASYRWDGQKVIQTK